MKSVAEHFDYWHDAFDAAVERQRPLVVTVGNDLQPWKVFPSRLARPVPRRGRAGAVREVAA